MVQSQQQAKTLDIIEKSLELKSTGDVPVVVK
jgi:hypothetical protein